MPSARLAHCTAWPDAPLTRLSSAEIAITHPVRWSTRSGDVDAVGPHRGLGRRRPLAHHHERLATVGIGQDREHLVGAGGAGWPGVAGCENPAVHGSQMGREEHLHVGAGVPGHRHLDLRGVAVGEQPVGGEVLVNRAERGVGLGRPARSRHPAGRVDDDPCRLNRAGRHQGGEGQGGRGHIAAWCGHQLGLPDPVAEQLGQAEDELTEQLGRGVLLAVPVRVQAGIVQPEVGSQVDDVAHIAAQVADHALRGAVGQGAEGQVATGGRSRLVGHERSVAVGGRQARVQVGHGLPGHRLTRSHDRLQVGMGRADSQQLCAGEPRRPDDGDLVHPAKLTSRGPCCNFSHTLVH